MYTYILAELAKNINTWMYAFDRADFTMLGLSSNRCLGQHA